MVDVRNCRIHNKQLQLIAHSLRYRRYSLGHLVLAAPSLNFPDLYTVGQELDALADACENVANDTGSTADVVHGLTI